MILTRDRHRHSMNVSQKLEFLEASLLDSSEFDHILDKLFDVVINQHQNRLDRYRRDLHEFEDQHNLDSAQFYQRFEAGEMGDAMDFFEWAGLYELYQALQGKINQLEAVA